MLLVVVQFGGESLCAWLRGTEHRNTRLTSTEILVFIITRPVFRSESVATCRYVISLAAADTQKSTSQASWAEDVWWHILDPPGY